MKIRRHLIFWYSSRYSDVELVINITIAKGLGIDLEIIL